MKKFLSLLLSCVLFFCSVITPLAATYINNSLDLSAYTLQDLKKMSRRDFIDLLKKFEQVYDPFDTYMSTPILETYPETQNVNNDISPLWSSGDLDSDGNYVEQGSHEYISAIACTVLENDIGFLGDNDTENVFIALAISLASLLPDRIYEEYQYAYEGHFYNPHTNKNYVGTTTNTAKTNYQRHYINAVTAINNGDETLAYKELGMALHYIQDACEPHHSSNNANVIHGLSHSRFEKHVDENIESYLNGFTSILNYDFRTNELISYNNNKYHTPAYNIKQAALISYEYRVYVLDVSNQSLWDYAGKHMVMNAVGFSAITINCFAYSASLSLT